MLSAVFPGIRSSYLVGMMTKKDIAKMIADQTGFTHQSTKEIVQRLLDAIVERLVSSQDKRVELRNFGVFEVRKRVARLARNPSTGEKVHVPAKYVVTFKPGKVIERRMRDLEALDARRERDEARKAQRSGDRQPGAIDSLDMPVQAEGDRTAPLS